MLFIRLGIEDQPTSGVFIIEVLVSDLGACAFEIISSP